MKNLCQEFFLIISLFFFSFPTQVAHVFQLGGKIDYLQECIWSKYALCLRLIIVGRLKLVGLSAQQLIGAGLNGGKYL